VVRAWTKPPVAVSGGFSPTDQWTMRRPDWDILIIGRSVADAVDLMPRSGMLYCAAYETTTNDVEASERSAAGERFVSVLVSASAHRSRASTAGTPLELQRVAFRDHAAPVSRSPTGPATSTTRPFRAAS
jgi:hypothetical protein